jgi:hypothetical protein
MSALGEPHTRRAALGAMTARPEPSLYRPIRNPYRIGPGLDDA